MSNKLDSIITEVDSHLKCIPIQFTNDDWRKDIPSKPGWYHIKTDTPFAILEYLNPPQFSAHINIPQTISNNAPLTELGIVISQKRADEYTVYNGEASNLKARAREHTRGHSKTFCLGLSNYKVVDKYRWSFCYTAALSCKSIKDIKKALSLAVEQGWRAKHGWPILCKK